MKKKYYYNENSFQEPISSEALYWLGFLYADGCMFKRKTGDSFVCNLALSQNDKSHVEKFKNFINTNKPIGMYKNAASGLASLSINNKIITSRLLKLGLIPRKSLIIQFPKFLDNNPNVNHFIRGYFDGDGCICEKKDKNKTHLHFTIVGTSNMMEKFMDIFVKELNIFRRKIIQNGKVYNLHINRTEDIKKVRQFLYKDATVFMDRKKLIFDNHTELKFATTSRYKSICKSTDRKTWRALYYDQNGKRKEKSCLKSEEEAYNFLKNLPLGCKIGRASCRERVCQYV